MSNLDILRSEMKSVGVNAYIVPTSDPHISEYLPEYYKERMWLTGFTGSAGVAVVTENEALLWTDGRYFIQAEREISSSGFSLIKMGVRGVPNYVEWLGENILEGKVGLNGLYFSQDEYNRISSALEKNGVSIVDVDLIANIFTNRKPLPKEPVFILPIEYAGESVEEKLRRIRDALEKKGADYTVINALPDICWLYNIRGGDIEYTPVVLSYSIISKDRALLFIDTSKVNSEVREFLEGYGVEILPYDEVFNYGGKLKGKIYLNGNLVNHRLYSTFKDNEIISGTNITDSLKAIKNSVEIENLKKAYIKDSVALVKYFHYLKTNVVDGELDEYKAQNILHDFRCEGEHFLEESFGTISAYGENAAMMHYSATQNSAAKLKKLSL